MIIRQPKRREVELRGRRKVNDVLKELDVNPESVIVVKGKQLLTRDALVAEDETIEVVSAISGGC